MTSAAAPKPRTVTASAAPPRELRLLRRIAGTRAEVRVLRVIAFGFLPGSLVFGLLVMPEMTEQQELFPLLWTDAVFVGVVVSTALMGALAFVAPVWLLRTFALVGAVTGLAAQATLPLLAMGWDRPLREAPWIDAITSLGTIASAIALPTSGAVGVTIAMAALTVVDRFAATHGDLLPGVQNGLYVLLFSLTFVALGTSSLRAGRAADVAEAAALRAATASAADSARERERARINALVHDRVLATLLTAARDVPGSEALRRQDAQRALDGLHALLRPEDDPLRHRFTGEEIAWAIQSVTTDLAPEALFGHDIQAELEIPADAVDALTAATEEALRNSLRHAGSANRAVHVLVDTDGVQVDVLDDGDGFDPARVPQTRLGIADSIHGRMASVDGGGAAVISSPGVGTRVQLRYRPEGAR